MVSKHVWVITGVNSGLGFALALHAASQGDKVIGTVRSLSKFPEPLKKASVSPLVVDFSGTDEELSAAAEEALRVYGTVDVLVNNAGFGVLGALEELKMSDIRAQFQTNVFGLIAFTQPFIAHFRTRRAGHIVNLSSVVAQGSVPGCGAYKASKAAVEAFTDALHQELALFGVRVLALVPGYFSSPFFSKLPAYAAAPAQPTAYTDPETQGFDSVHRVSQMHVAARQIGDPAKYAARVWEVVAGAGLAAAHGVVARARTDSEGGACRWEGPWAMNHVPLGPDCGAVLEARFGVLQENLRLFKPITDSTDVEEERLKYFPRG